VSAIFPVLWAILGGEELGLIGFVGLGLGLVAIVLVGFIPEKNAVRPSIKGLSLAVGAGILIGAFMIFIDQAPADAGLTPLISNRIASATIMGGAIAVLALMGAARRRRAGVSAPATHEGGNASGWRAGLKLAILCGFVDGTGNALLLLGIQIGDLSVMSVLTAMYPAGTVILAAIILKERVAPIQAVGLVLAIVAAAMLALA
jgi:drug/metabolite transporter (DMT)-like permease